MFYKEKIHSASLFTFRTFAPYCNNQCLHRDRERLINQYIHQNFILN